MADTPPASGDASAEALSALARGVVGVQARPCASERSGLGKARVGTVRSRCKLAWRGLPRPVARGSAFSHRDRGGPARPGPVPSALARLAQGPATPSLRRQHVEINGECMAAVPTCARPHCRSARNRRECRRIPERVRGLLGGGVHRTPAAANRRMDHASYRTRGADARGPRRPTGACPAATRHTVAMPETLKWVEPAVLPGARLAHRAGRPEQGGVVRLPAQDARELPDPARTFTRPARTSRCSPGVFFIGIGEKFDQGSGAGAAGRRIRLDPAEPRRTSRWAGDQETIVQVHGVGPTDLRFVNPADDPRKKK